MKWLRVLIFCLLSGCTFVIRTPAFRPPRDAKPNLFRGVYHVHTEYSHDSKASLELVIKTAETAGLDFVVVTDHNNLNAASAYQTMKKPDRPLLIFGDEISTWNDGHLVALGIGEKPPDIEDTQEIVNLIHQKAGYAVPAHPFSLRKPWTNWNIENFDGFEIFCFSDVFYSEDIRRLILKAFFLPPKAFLKSVLKTPTPALQLWDKKLASGRRVTAFGSADAHLKWQWHGMFPENYLLYFQAVTMYVLADELKEEKIVEALGQGKSFIAFEARGLAQDFSFQASRADESYGPGDSPTAEVPILFKVKSPDIAHIRLIRNGEVIHEAKEIKLLAHEVHEVGAYRAEVYKKSELWIVSNPIYVTDRELPDLSS